MAELTPQRIGLPVRFVCQEKPSNGFAPHVLVLFGASNQFVELAVDDVRVVARSLNRFLADVDAQVPK